MFIYRVFDFYNVSKLKFNNCITFFWRNRSVVNLFFLSLLFFLLLFLSLLDRNIIRNLFSYFFFICFIYFIR